MTTAELTCQNRNIALLDLGLSSRICLNLPGGGGGRRGGLFAQMIEVLTILLDEERQEINLRGERKGNILVFCISSSG